MSVKNAAIATGIVVSAMTGLVLLPSNAQVVPATAAIPATGIDLGIYEQLAQVRAELARESAEYSRREVPAVIAARAEAERIAAEQARLAAEAAAKAEAEAQAAAKAEAEAAAAKKAQARSSQGSSAAATAPAPASGAAASGDRGISTSAYTGPYYNPAYEATRQCIVRRESGGNYGIVSSNGLYFGAYQFSRSTGDATARMMGRPDLVGRTVNTWTRAEQDEAFWTLWNNGAGRGHWGTAPGC